MRVLTIMRGAPGCGKSTFVQNKGWAPYTLAPDVLRLQMQSPVLDKEGRVQIPQSNDKDVWKLLFEMLERRMQQGCFTVVDATHTKTSDMNRYKDLCEKYRYRQACVDMSDVPLDVLKQRNASREPLRRVPDEVLEDMYHRCRTQTIPGRFTRLTAASADELLFRCRDLSSYKRIVHIGDIHGCYSPLSLYLGGKVLREDTFYIFLGDYVDRGTENAEVVSFLLELADRENVLFLEGNHERWLNDYGNNQVSRSREFELWTRPQLHEAGISAKDMRMFYRKLGQCVFYRYHDRMVLVNHGGIPRIPENLLYVNAHQLVHGVGRYGDASHVEKQWDALMPENYYQIHAHRNTEDLSIHPSARCFNLEGQVEFGGCLRVVELTEDGFETDEIRNPMDPRKRERKSDADELKVVEAGDVSVAGLVGSLRANGDIRERKFGAVSSFNFTRNVFEKGRWNEMTCKARGLYINTETSEIVARAYDKFFNVNEREETRLESLAESFSFPVTAYVKENGYLGIVGYDASADDLIITSKSDLEGPFARMFREILLREVDEEKLKAYMRGHRCSLVFEVMDPVRDPHIIAYDRAFVVLLDEVKNRVDFERLPYEELVALAGELGVAVKRRAAVFKNAAAFDKWRKSVSDRDFLYKGEYIEGFVLEDGKGFMTKLKLDYYKMWKGLRSAAQAIVKQGYLSRPLSRGTMLTSCFVEWLQTEIYPQRAANGGYPFATDIISLRERYMQARGLK